MSQDVEPSMIDYARFYGLVQDHLEDKPLQGLAAPHDFLSQLDDTADLFQIRSDCVKVPEERWPVDAGTASLLSEIVALAKRAPPRFDGDDEFEIHRVRQMKRELPLLRTDPEADLVRFAPRIVPNLEREFLPLETVDEEADEGFEWPSTYHDLPDEYHRKLKAERLVFPKEALIYLQETLRFHLEGGSHEVFDSVELPYTRKSKVQPVSPPLLHMSPVTLPFVPSSDTGKLELLSDPTSPTREEAREAERRIFDDDAFLPSTREAEASSQDPSQVPLDLDSLGNLYSPLKGIADPPSSPQTPRRLLQDRKVDPPLSPPTSEQLPPWKRKSVSWKESLTDVMQDIPLPIPKPENVSSDDIDAFFEESIRPMGIKAERSIEQEQLQEVDTTLRVTIPIMDFSRPVAPWNANSQDMKAKDKDRYKHNLSEMKTLHFSKHSWPISGKLDRELKWTAIPAALGKIEQESISDDGIMEDYLMLPDRVDVETLTWKPDGLRIFDEPAVSDEELSEGVFPEERDIESLVKKRKLELEFIEDDLPQHDVSLKAPRTELPKENEEAHFGGPRIPFASFSALDALDSYMGVRTGQIEKPKLTAGRYFPPVSAAADTESPKQVTKPDIRATVAEHRPMPSPAVTVPTSTISFVASASFLSNRKLARQIQRLFPCAEFIERDFNLYLDPQQTPASKPNTCSATQSTMADEADLSLSPSTGLIWTTLQKIKQRSLPGQATRSAVQERISGAAPRYERLLVLVSEDCQAGDSLGIVTDGISQVDSRDCEALVELTKLCLTLQSDVHVTFIAGGEDDLANWIVAMMVKYAVTDPDIKLIQDETLWEVFLRRAGMNAFASQAILGCLKAVDQDEGGGSAAVFGLTAFVKMSARERFARFETMLGGRRMLGRASRALDARW